MQSSSTKSKGRWHDDEEARLKILSSEYSQLQKSLSSTQSNKGVKKNTSTERISISKDVGGGRVKVFLGSANKQKSWKPSIDSKQSDNGLLGNRCVTRWDDEGEVNMDDLVVKQREHAFKEIKSIVKTRKRELYLDSWDAGLDEGKVSLFK